MLVGIICTVVIALVAAYQTWASHLYFQSAELYREALYKQRAHTDVAIRKLECIVAVLPLHESAALRGDARQCDAILATAIQQANAIRVPE